MEYLIGLMVIVMVLINVPIGFALTITAVVIVAIKGIGLLTVPLNLFHGADNFPLIAIPLFVLAGQLMNTAGLSVRLINFCSALVGFIRGGLAMVNIVASMFFAEISGSAVADAAALGSILIPAMKKKGYPADFSAAVTSASATQAIIIPPSIPMIIYAVMAECSIVELFMAGLIPGVMAGISMMILSYYFAVKKKYPIEEAFNLRKLWVTFKEASWAFLLPVIIIGGIFGGIFTATEAASMAVMAAFFIGVFVYKELRFRELPQVLLNCGIQTAVVMMIVAGSALLSWLLSNELIPQRIAATITAATENKYVVLMLMNIFFLFAGMFLHSAAAIIMIVPIVMPLVHKMGIDPIHFGLIVTFNLGIGQQTPPVASVLLTTCSVARISISEVMRVNIYFIFLAICVLIILTYLPEISLFLPNLLLR
jgi:tripartite ATP-independent transporter DctM subunit